MLTNRNEALNGGHHRCREPRMLSKSKRPKSTTRLGVDEPGGAPFHVTVGTDRAERAPRSSHDLSVENQNGTSDDEHSAPRRPFWDLWEDGVRETLLESFVRCRETCRLQFLEGWSSHARYQTHELRDAVRWSQWKARRAALFEPEMLVNKYRRLWTKYVPDPPAERVWKQEVVFAYTQVFLEAAFRHWPDDLQRTWTAVCPTTRVPWMYPDGRTAPVGGRVLGMEDGSGRLWLFDTYLAPHSTIRQLKEWGPLSLRTALGLYVLRQITGKMPAGVIFNLLDRPVYAWPETARDLEDAIQQSRRQFEAVPRACLHRAQVRIPRRRFDQCVNGLLAPLMNDVRAWAEGGNHYLNAANLYPYTEMYAAVVRGDFSRCYRRKSAFGPLMS